MYKIYIYIYIYILYIYIHSKYTGFPHKPIYIGFSTMFQLKPRFHRHVCHVALCPAPRRDASV